ncbi:hypothetical protein LJR230_004681 [Trinickia sp. LjRoot230]|uniref:cyanobactin maturation protease PatG family protein n=1 Tax=Trinickia sp. LjRoot230 TaxID=3342288 RepID=UPI003ECFE60A
MQPPSLDASMPLQPPVEPGSLEPSALSAPCPECAARVSSVPVEQFVYAIGRLDVRFPSLGIEREYQQRERALTDLQEPSRTARIRAVLEKNPHLALRMGYLFVVDGTAVYALSPAGGHLKESLFAALTHADDKDHYCTLIGRTGGFAAAPAYGGLLLTSVTADQLYDFSLDEWGQRLAGIAQAALKSRKIEATHFDTVAKTLFRELCATPDNLGSADGHRALNYLLVQHPGLFLAAAERRDHVLDHVETRMAPTAGGRRHVVLVLTFLDRTTGVPERLYCTVDVTEEWPFVVGAHPSGTPLGFAPFVETAVTLSA